MGNYVVSLTGSTELLSDDLLKEYHRVFGAVNDLCKRHSITTEVIVFINKRRVYSTWGDFDAHSSNGKGNEIRIFPKGMRIDTQKLTEEEHEIHSICLLIHEIAHHLISIEGGRNRKRYKDHGKEWRAVFEYILKDCGYWIDGRVTACGLQKIKRIEQN